MAAAPVGKNLRTIKGLDRVVRGIFDSHADFSCRVSFELTGQMARFQRFEDIPLLHKQIEDRWIQAVGIEGISAFSLIHGEIENEITAIGRYETYFRQPREREIYADFNSHPEVLGELIPPGISSFDRTPTIDFFGNRRYIGPQRMEKTVITTKIISGVYADITAFIEELDASVIPGRSSHLQAYLILIARQGNLFYLRLPPKPDAERNYYDLRNFKYHGALFKRKDASGYKYIRSENK